MKKVHLLDASDPTKTLCGRETGADTQLAAHDTSPTCLTCQRCARSREALQDSHRGILLVRDALILSGSPANCTRPAAADVAEAKTNTEEWREIRRESVRRDSARWELLHSRILRKLRTAAEQVAVQQGVDCIVRAGDIRDAGGLPVLDVTASLVSILSRPPR